MLVNAFDTKIAVVSAWNGATQQNVSGSVGSFGVNDGELDVGETLRFDFGAENTFGVGTFDPSPNLGTQFATFTGPAVEFATFSFAGFGGSGDQITYVVHYTDNSSDLAVAVNSSGSATLGTDGKIIAYVEFTGSAASGSSPNVGLTSITLDHQGPLANPTVNKVLFISDGEPTAGTNFASLVTTIESTFGPIEAVGINVSETALDQLDLVEGAASGAPAIMPRATLRPENSSKPWLEN